MARKVKEVPPRERQYQPTFTLNEILLVRSLLEKHSKQLRGGIKTRVDISALEAVKSVMPTSIVDYNRIGRESDRAPRVNRIDLPGNSRKS